MFLVKLPPPPPPVPRQRGTQQEPSLCSLFPKNVYVCDCYIKNNEEKPLVYFVKDQDGNSRCISNLVYGLGRDPLSNGDVSFLY